MYKRSRFPLSQSSSFRITSQHPIATSLRRITYNRNTPRKRCYIERRPDLSQAFEDTSFYVSFSTGKLQSQPRSKLQSRDHNQPQRRNMSEKLIPADPEKVMVIRDISPNVVTFSVPFLRFGKFKVGGRATVGTFASGLLFLPPRLPPFSIEIIAGKES